MPLTSISCTRATPDLAAPTIVRWVFCTKLRLAIDVLQDRVTGGRTPGTVSLRGLAFVLPHLTFCFRAQATTVSRQRSSSCVSSGHETSERAGPTSSRTANLILEIRRMRRGLFALLPLSERLVNSGVSLARSLGIASCWIRTRLFEA
jgi:hypothetical protein